MNVEEVKKEFDVKVNELEAKFEQHGIGDLYVKGEKKSVLIEVAVDALAEFAPEPKKADGKKYAPDIQAKIDTLEKLAAGSRGKQKEKYKLLLMKLK